MTRPGLHHRRASGTAASGARTAPPIAAAQHPSGIHSGRRHGGPVPVSTADGPAAIAAADRSDPRGSTGETAEVIRIAAHTSGQPAGPGLETWAPHGCADRTGTGIAGRRPAR